jgi:hypothetical protein
MTAVSTGDTATLPLRPARRRHATIVDRAYLPPLAGYNWWVVPRPDGRGSYAARWVGAGSRRRTVYVHRELSGAPAGSDVIHLNDDGLDNRRAYDRAALEAFGPFARLNFPEVPSC